MTDTCELMDELKTHPRRLKRLEDFHQADGRTIEYITSRAAAPAQ